MKRFYSFSLVLLGALFLSACSSASRSASWPGLTADAKNAYLANGQFVYAVRLSDGSKVWQYPASGGSQLFASNPVLSPDGQLLAASAGSDRGLYSIDPVTGKDKWTVPFTGATDHWVASPLVVGDTIYAPNNDGSLYALKLATGEKLWSLPISDSLWDTPATDGTLIFITSLDHFLYAVDPQAQKISWKVDLGGAIAGSPVLTPDGKTVFVGASSRKVFAIQAATGTILWKATTADWVWSAPTLSDDSVFTADISGNVYSLSAVNGKNAWPVVLPDGPIAGSPVALSNSAPAVANGSATPTNAPATPTTSPATPTSSPAVPPGGVAVATESGYLYAFDAHGSPSWNINVGGNIYTTPVVSNNLIIVSPLNADFLLAAVTMDGQQIKWKFTGK